MEGEFIPSIFITFDHLILTLTVAYSRYAHKTEDYVIVDYMGK